MPRQVAIIPSQGIGDALLMLSAAPPLLEQGYKVNVYHDAIRSLADWFPSVSFHAKNAFTPCEWIIAQNDNSPFIQKLVQEHRSCLSLFYPTYKTGKHAPLHTLDKVFDPTCSMVHNIAQATAALCNRTPTSFSNGITPPSGLYFRAFLKRVILHPTSREKEKNWAPRSFVALAKKLQHHGFFPLFVVSPEEKEEWLWIQKEGLPLRAPATLSACAALFYESGSLIGNDSFAGHLASNLGLPTLILAKDKEKLKLWRPGWKEGKVLVASRSLQEISVRHALFAFIEQSRSTTAL